MAEPQQDVDALKRRGRRRLVGAVALVLLAVIVLPMVFDSAPRSSAPPVSVRIPGEDEAPFAPKLPAKPPVEVKKEAPKVEPPKPEAPAKAEAPKPRPRAPEVEKPKIAGNTLPPKPPVAAERARAEAALSGQQYFVPVGAFSSPQPVFAKLKEARIPYFTEDLAVAGGKVTRVRAGPFASKEAAEKSAERLKGLGFKPGNVAAKAG